ncbi:hypothetical protein Tco_0180725, partial [Tanacetum coccineum]
MRATLRDILSNQFRDAEEYAYHLEQSQNYMENQIVWESRKEDLKRPKLNALNGNTKEKRIVEVFKVNIEQQHGLHFMKQIIVMRENEKLCSFSEAHFKYLNKNDIEDMYYLCLNKKINYREHKLLNSIHMFIKRCVIWERVHDFQLEIESYQVKINLTTPTLIFPGIEECDPFSIVDKPTTGLIYLNINNEKRFMDLEELAKFCDATLENMLKEVKMKIFKTEFIKKTPLLESILHFRLLLGEVVGCDQKIEAAGSVKDVTNKEEHVNQNKMPSLKNLGQSMVENPK